jgi:ketosteroid isomerase-like protein
MFLMSLPCFRVIALVAALSSPALVLAQQAPGVVPGTPNGYRLVSPLAQPTFTPGVIQLMQLEAKFAEDVAKGGGKAFASWFADDAVTLANGKPAVLGRGAIAAQANWSPTDYSLTWTAQGAQMSASNEMGFTWGHYTGRSKDTKGNPIVTSGRYITVWKKLADGTWKVALDASSDDAPDSGSCCTLLKP